MVKLGKKRMMKKQLTAVLLVCCMLFGLTPVSVQAKITYMSDLPKDGFVNYSDDAAENQRIQKMLERLPAYVREILRTDSCQIHSSADPEDYSLMSGGLGYCTMGAFDTKIVIKKGSDARVLYHEIGHAYDAGAAGMYSTAHHDEFDKIYKAEMYKFRGFPDTSYSHTRSTAEEYFAESFALYFLDRGKLKKYAPKTYAYMQKVLQKKNVQKYVDEQARYSDLGYMISVESLKEDPDRHQKLNYLYAVRSLPFSVFQTLSRNGWRTAYTDQIKTTGKYNAAKKMIYINEKLIKKKYPENTSEMIQKTITRLNLQAYLADQGKKGTTAATLAARTTDWLYGKPLDKTYGAQIRKLCHNAHKTDFKIKKAELLNMPSKEATSKITVVKKIYEDGTDACNSAKFKLTYDLGAWSMLGLAIDEQAKSLRINGGRIKLKGNDHGQAEFTLDGLRNQTYSYTIVTEKGNKYKGKLKVDFVKEKEDPAMSDAPDNVLPNVEISGYPSGTVMTGTPVQMTFRMPEVDCVVNLNGKTLGDGSYGRSFTFTVTQNGDYPYTVITKYGKMRQGVLQIFFFNDVNDVNDSSDSTTGSTDDATITPAAPSDGVKDPLNDPLQKPLEPAGA